MARTLRSFLADEWLPAIRLPAVRPSTWGTYRRHLGAYFMPAIGDIELERLTPAQLSALYRELLTTGRRRTKARFIPKTVRNRPRGAAPGAQGCRQMGLRRAQLCDVVDAP